MNVTFHVNVSDVPDYTSRLIRKARAQSLQVVVTGPDDMLSRIDQHLWTFVPHGFLAHAGVGATLAVLQRSPVVLAAHLDTQLTADVLINLGQETPLECERFNRVIDIVSADEADRRAGRARWKHWVTSGATPTMHDAAGPVSTGQ